MIGVSQTPQAHARLPRRVLPELLDELAADDPRAVRSRRDLKLVNRIMGAKSALLWAIDATPQPGPRRIVELGAGDGTMALRIARSRARQWLGTSVTLLDRQPVVDGATLAAIGKLGWTVDVAGADVFDWLVQPAAAADLILRASPVPDDSRPSISAISVCRSS